MVGAQLPPELLLELDVDPLLELDEELLAELALEVLDEEPPEPLALDVELVVEADELELPGISPEVELDEELVDEPPPAPPLLLLPHAVSSATAETTATSGCAEDVQPENKMMTNDHRRGGTVTHPVTS